MQSDQLQLASDQFDIKEARKKMSKASRLRTDFKSATDHIKDRVVSNIIEAKNRGVFRIEDAELQKLARVVESAFEQGFITSSGQIEKSIEEATK